jgi:hypothetical protein
VRPQGLPAAADEEQDAEGDPNAPARHSTLSLPGPGVHPQQALCCVQVMTLLMQQHLRALLEGGLAAYLDMWQAYAVEPGSLEACAGVCVCVRVCVTTCNVACACVRLCASCKAAMPAAPAGML